MKELKDLENIADQNKCNGNCDDYGRFCKGCEAGMVINEISDIKRCLIFNYFDKWGRETK